MNSVVWTFQNRRYSESGNRLPPVAVEMRGRSFCGCIVDGDDVEASALGWQEGQTGSHAIRRYFASDTEVMHTWAEMILPRVRRTVGFAVLCSGFLTGQTRQGRRVEIATAWEGWESSIRTTFLILRHRDAYWCRSKPVDARLVNALLVALNEAAIPEPNLQNLGLTKEWLEAAVLGIPASGWLGVQREAFRDAFTDHEFVKNVFTNPFRSRPNG